LAGVETETRTVDLSILDCTLGCLNSAITHYSYCQEVLGGVSAGEGNASIYDARDGKVFAGFSASSRVGIDRLAEIVKRPLPSRDPAEVKDLLARLIAGLGKEEAMKLGQSVRFPWSIHNDLLSILDASHLRERAFFARPGGADDVPVASAPFRMGLAPPCLAPAPRAGADTVAVFAELNTVEDESTC
jgi:crotonobetainyl-CoA:carnitine CoA-transferase CaiB-like acyl-CoA transferase